MKSKQTKKSKIIYIILLVFLFIGVGLVLYPTVSNYWNSFRHSKAIATYSDVTKNLTEEENKKIWSSAVEFNKEISKNTNCFELTPEQKNTYYNLLDVSKTGMIGYIEIPSIDVFLPIYHGNSEAVLQKGAGHMEWSSLPVGGEGTHCIISAHRGLPSAKLFTNLNKLSEGDIFILYVLDQKLTYEVDNTSTVLPKQTDMLKIFDKKDYCTLITCTPYGVNTHRLLVRGHRVETAEELSKTFISEASKINNLLVALIVFFPLFAFSLILTYAFDKKHR